MTKTCLFMSIALIAGDTEAAAVAGRDADAAVEAPQWRVRTVRDRKPEHVCIDNGVIYVSLNRGQAWTIAQVTYKRDELVGQYGANGTVSACAKGLWGGDKSGWVGTGHGGEIIESFHLIVDGKMHEYSSGVSLAGREVTTRKVSKLGPFRHTAEITFPASGDCLVEKHSYAVIEDAAGFKSMYAFMHCMNKTIKDWSAVLAEGGSKEGRAADGLGKFVLQEEFKSLACWGDANRKGVVYIYPEIYAGGDSFKNSIWDRKRDTKLYLRPQIPSLEIGSHFSFSVKLVPFEAGPEDWRERGRELANEHDFELRDSKP
ncbi:MAG: hypothetical protein HN742_31700 [Lentisphaerae bacterium]|jgi:hypothetical protein|nr:hypothetical protein [Lentisphaerota bacterium]MBT4816709.1 hypothetical protein [Lentisphaerota bacterium]MBT5606478.1 hypothetical protein [Lentisphaerota bacterium]MBT7058862.1 hypothetical protein [Lentisphaerota bacterium]MBT7846477.1 hypothetical protein [Lentisphaerota bacterium]